MNTNIPWSTHTWNPWLGCHKVSEACQHCYMYREVARFKLNDPNVVTRTVHQTFYAPRRWNKKFTQTFSGFQTVFTCSWSDYFIEEADPWRGDAWKVIEETPNLFYLILTKRIERAVACLPKNWGEGWPGVGIGVTVENQRNTHRLDTLRTVPTKLRFVSIEPLLGPIDLTPWKDCLDWVIVGCESGEDRRAPDLEWVREIVQFCKKYNIPVFVKQLNLEGEVVKDMKLFPADLQVQEFPSFPMK